MKQILIIFYLPPGHNLFSLRIKRLIKIWLNNLVN